MRNATSLSKSTVSPLMTIMNRDGRVYVAGHRGLAGSAILRALEARGYCNIITRTHAALDLTDAAATGAFFEAEKPDYVFLAAARVGGILANNERPAEFIRDNLAIQTNVIHEAWRASVKRLLFLGSSCIYPREAPQALKEEYLLTGQLEATNRPYALAKIAGIEMCWSYNRQYGTRYLAVMPTNLYGPGDNYDLASSHVLPALLRKFHEAKLRGDATVTVWGTGTPRREILYSEDMADACLFLMEMPNTAFDIFLATEEARAGRFVPPLVNVGLGQDVTIRQLAETVAEVTGFKGGLVFDASKPDGTMRKLMDVSKLKKVGWSARTQLKQGLALAYQDFLQTHHAP